VIITVLPNMKNDLIGVLRCLCEALQQRVAYVRSSVWGRYMGVYATTWLLLWLVMKCMHMYIGFCSRPPACSYVLRDYVCRLSCLQESGRDP
jgi:hypothetical protein